MARGTSRPAAPTRSIEARLASLHLRVGLYGLARAELEAMAARATLDREALADLAEVRWRSGDLTGAGEAARAHLAERGEALVALVIAAEAAAAVGRLAEARRLAELAGERGGPGLEAVFAGERHGSIWRGVLPADAEGGVAAEAVLGGVGGAAMREPAGPVVAPSAPHGPPLAGAHALERAEASLRDHEPARAAVELAVALRREPSLAQPILDLLARAPRVTPASWAAPLEIVRGDAYRMVGRHRDASDAYDLAVRLATAAGQVGRPAKTVPGEASTKEKP